MVPFVLIPRLEVLALRLMYSEEFPLPVNASMVSVPLSSDIAVSDHVPPAGRDPNLKSPGSGAEVSVFDIAAQVMYTSYSVFVEKFAAAYERT